MLSLIKRVIQLLPGFLLIAAVIWIAGPYLVISGNRPLESESSRLIAIVGVVLAWLAWVMFERWQARRASGKLASAVITQAAAEPLPSGDVVKLREGFEQAVATLGSRHKGRTLYDLPWYVFIGPPGSGKTTALLNSGLHFSLDALGGQARLRGIGGTRNCDWWFTDEAVFLDTAGRFTTQDSDAAADSAGWKEFLALLTKYRKRRPINGVILTISVKDLLTQGEFAREQQVEAARYRLRELGRELQIELPVYVMVTMCDLIAGFAEYFDDQVQDGRAQVWGVTFPYEQTASGQAARNFPPEFEALVRRLNERVFARLEEETDARRRAKIFAFPQQMASLRDSLAHYLTDVFAATSYEQRILLRGVYLTSGTQEGTPIDRLLGAIGRGFRVAPEAVVAPGGRGKAFFVERLLTQVVLGESGLAGVNRRFEMRTAGVTLAAYAALVALTVVGVMALSVSYRRNAEYLADLEREVARLRAVPTARTVTSAQGLLPRLDAIRDVVRASNRYNDSLPWGMRWGLYQGWAMSNAAHDAYMIELDSSLLPFVAARLQQRLAQYGREPEKLYEYLKAYLMLGQPEHVNEKHLQYLVNHEWSSANGVPDAAGASLAQHFQALLDSGEKLRPMPMNSSLVSQACSTVKRASLGRIMYSWLRETYASNDSQGVRLDVAGGVAATQVIRRKSGVDLSQPVPSLFSRGAFDKITGSDLPELVDEFAKDNWVCDGGSNFDKTRLQGELTNVYQQEYIAAWDAVLNDLMIVTPSTVDGMADLLGVLGGPASPLKNLLDVITENTRLTQPAKAEAPAETGILAKGKSYADRVTTIFKQGPAAAAPATAGALVTARFQDIHRLVEGEPGKTPIEAALNRLRDVEQQLRGFGAAYGQKSIEAAQGDQQLRTLFMQIGRESETLPSPVRQMIEQIGDRAESTVGEASTGALASAYRKLLADCERLIAGRYPFAANSSSEIPLTEFGELFGPKGVFDRFFTEQLEARVDTSTRPWTWKPGTAPPSSRMLPHFEQARAIRDAFFPGGTPLPSLRFSVTIAAVDAATTQLVVDIDGQKFEDKKPGAVPATWPGENAGSASATFNDRTGIGSGYPRFEGPWALFRFIDAGQPRHESDTRTTLTVRGRRAHEAQVVIDAVSLDNPFAKREWQRFGCGA